MPDPTISTNEQTQENDQVSEFKFDDAAPSGAAPAEPTAAVESPMASADVDKLIESIPLAPGFSTFKLPSGVDVLMRTGKGRDLLAAQRAAGTDAHQTTYALAAVLCTFDGQRKVMEDILDMPLGDVMQLMGKIGDQAGDFLPSTTAPSSTSPQ